MENSPYVAVTLDIFETLWRDGFTNVGVVLQSALHRSEADLRRVNALGARVRLVKGAYTEPADIAWQRRADVDAAYVRLMELLLREGTFPALATHDPAIIAAAQAFAAKHGIARDTFEFQMLYGIRRDLQAALAAEGYGMRVYIPFGREWFPYYMRRLGERPANVAFVLRGHPVGAIAITTTAGFRQPAACTGRGRCDAETHPPAAHVLRRRMCTTQA